MLGARTVDAALHVVRDRAGLVQVLQRGVWVHASGARQSATQRDAQSGCDDVSVVAAQSLEAASTPQRNGAILAWQARIMRDSYSSNSFGRGLFSSPTRLGAACFLVCFTLRFASRTGLAAYGRGLFALPPSRAQGLVASPLHLG